MKPIRSLCFVLLAALAMPSADAALPNIVFILADDLGYADMSFLPRAAADVKKYNVLVHLKVRNPKSINDFA